MLSEVATLNQHKVQAKEFKDKLDEIFMQTPTPDLKPFYDKYSAEAVQIDDDVKEANRRKPKKAKAATEKKDKSP